MVIEVRLFATLRRYAPSSASGVVSLDVNDSFTIEDVMNQLGIGAEEVHVIMVNGVSSDLKHVLADGDRVGLFPAVGGG